MTEFENFEEKIIDAYKEWGSKQSDQNAPALYAGPRTWTVSELVAEFEQKTPFGLSEIESLKEFLKEHPYVGVKGILKMISGEPLESELEK